MDYESLVAKAIAKELTEEDAIDYLGEEICKQIIELAEFCKKNNLQLYCHGTMGTITGDEILKRGYLFSTREMSELDFCKSTGIANPKEAIKFKEGTTIDEGTVSQETLYDWYGHSHNGSAEEIRQHFTEGFKGMKDVVARFIEHNYGAPCDTMVFMILPKDRTPDECVVSCYTYGVPTGTGCLEERYIKCDAFPRTRIAGYLDIRNKKMVYNPRFGMSTEYSVNNGAFMSMIGPHIQNPSKEKGVEK